MDNDSPTMLGLTVHGFEPLDVISLRLDPGLDVVVGANGAGRSRLLGALTGDRIGAVDPSSRRWIHIQLTQTANS